jgi:hypothetical protein
MQSTPNASPRIVKRRRDHLNVTDHWHKIRVAVPPWNDMDVEMIWNACASRRTEIHANIDTVRFV